MKRPLVIVALLYVAGILLGDMVEMPLPALLGLSVAAAVFAVAAPRFRSRALPVVVFLVGASNQSLHTQILSPHDLRLVVGDAPALVRVRGVLRDSPSLRVTDVDDGQRWRTLAVLEVHSLRRGTGDWSPVTGRVLVTTPDILGSEYFAGVEVEAQGVLRPPQTAAVPGAFDYRAFLRRKGIYYQLQAASTNDWHVLPDPESPARPPLSQSFIAWAQHNLARGLPVEDDTLQLLWRMTLGWKTGMSGEMAQPFMRSGTMHIFAISGLHIALIAGILVALLRVGQVPRGVCGLIVIPALWFYTGATGWQASAVRSTVMMTIVIGGWSLRRPGDLLNSLAAAALIILLWNPQQLFQASFQLSFFVVLSLALIGPWLERMGRRWWELDPLVPEDLRPRWQRWSRPAVRGFVTAFVASLAAWLGSMPLVAEYFHLFTPVCLLANLLIVPLSGLALASAVASLLVGSWWPACAELFNHSAWFWMKAMTGISEWAARLPGAWFHVPAPSAITLAFYYGALISLLAGWWFKPRVRVWVAAVLGTLGALWIVQWHQDRTETRLTVMPVGGGWAVYSDEPGRTHDLLMDCGNVSSAEFAVRSFLHAQGVGQLPRLLLTHGDIRQSGGAEFIVDEFGVEQVLTSPLRFRSPTYRKFMERFSADQPARGRQVQRGDRLGRWTVLHPQAKDQFDRADDGAVVLLGEFDGTRVLLVSDLGRLGQRTLLERAGDLRADIVVSGLPAQDEPLSDALLAAVQPRAIIVADSEFPATRRAGGRLRERLERRGVPVFFTRETGAVTIRVHAGGWETIPMRKSGVLSDEKRPQSSSPAHLEHSPQPDD